MRDLLPGVLLVVGGEEVEGLGVDVGGGDLERGFGYILSHSTWVNPGDWYLQNMGACEICQNDLSKLMHFGR